MKKYILADQLVEQIEAIEKTCNIKLENITYQGIVKGNRNFVIINTISADVILSKKLLSEVAQINGINEELTPLIVSAIKQKKFIFQELQTKPCDYNFNYLIVNMNTSTREAQTIIKKFLIMLNKVIKQKISKIIQSSN